jgi:hypothetical protein
MANPIAPQPISVPDLRRVSQADYHAGFNSLVRRLEREEVEHPPAVPERPLRDPQKVSDAVYHKELDDLVRRLRLQGVR